MPKLDTIEADLKNFIVDQLFVDLRIDEINVDQALGSEIGIDSLGFTEIVAFVEDNYNIEVQDDEFIPDNFRTLDAIIKLVRLKAAASVSNNSTAA